MRSVTDQRKTHHLAHLSHSLVLPPAGAFQQCSVQCCCDDGTTTTFIYAVAWQAHRDQACTCLQSADIVTGLTCGNLRGMFDIVDIDVVF